VLSTAPVDTVTVRPLCRNPPAPLIAVADDNGVMQLCATLKCVWCAILSALSCFLCRMSCQLSYHCRLHDAALAPMLIIALLNGICQPNFSPLPLESGAQ
jgi:hypothetical protein